MRVERLNDGTLEIVRDARRFLYLFDDGTLATVIADRDDSDVRAAVLQFVKADGIAGVAPLPDQDRLL